MRRPPHIHLTGASGAGVTTLGCALAARLGAVQLDTDTFYWLPTESPFKTKRTVEERLRMLREAFARAENSGWILSGSIGSWGGPLVRLFDLVAFVDTPTEVRMDRLHERERRRVGAAMDPGGEHHESVMAFLDWASRYETGDHGGGRSRAVHEAWLKAVPCPVLRLDGTRPIEALAEEVEATWQALQP
jgi:adenylate kinase family enzyme